MSDQKNFKYFKIFKYFKSITLVVHLRVKNISILNITLKNISVNKNKKLLDQNAIISLHSAYFKYYVPQLDLNVILRVYSVYFKYYPTPSVLISTENKKNTFKKKRPSTATLLGLLDQKRANRVMHIDTCSEMVSTKLDLYALLNYRLDSRIISVGIGILIGIPIVLYLIIPTVTILGHKIITTLGRLWVKLKDSNPQDFNRLELARKQSEKLRFSERWKKVAVFAAAGIILLGGWLYWRSNMLTPNEIKTLKKEIKEVVLSPQVLEASKDPRVTRAKQIIQWKQVKNYFHKDTIFSPKIVEAMKDNRVLKEKEILHNRDNLREIVKVLNTIADKSNKARAGFFTSRGKGWIAPIEEWVNPENCNQSLFYQGTFKQKVENLGRARNRSFFDEDTLEQQVENFGRAKYRYYADVLFSKLKISDRKVKEIIKIAENLEITADTFGVSSSLKQCSREGNEFCYKPGLGRVLYKLGLYSQDFLIPELIKVKKPSPCIINTRDTHKSWLDILIMIFTRTKPRSVGEFNRSK